jgi:hypothetical protein
MQSPTTAQLGAAIVGLEPFGEHINHAAANTAIGWPEAQHYDHHAANIEARTIEQTDRIQTVGAQWNSGVTNCCRGEGSVFFIMFNTGHALPLPGGRSSCPQRSRGRDATCPRENNDLCPRTRTVHISDPATDSPQSRNVHVHEQSLTSFSPRPQTCPRIGRVRVQASAWTVRSHALAMDANCPWTVHGLELSTSPFGPCPRFVRDLRLSGTLRDGVAPKQCRAAPQKMKRLNC